MSRKEKMHNNIINKEKQMRNSSMDNLKTGGRRGQESQVTKPRTDKSKLEKAVKMATPKQVIMIEKILPRMFKNVHDIFLEYHVTSLFQLTHKQVGEIKAKFDAYMREHPERGTRGYHYN